MLIKKPSFQHQHDACDVKQQRRIMLTALRKFKYQAHCAAPSVIIKTKLSFIERG